MSAPSSPPSKVQDTSTRLSHKRGNGILRREDWVDAKGKVVRYNLAFINHEIFQGDNGRVIGYVNARGLHHRHYKGKVEAVEFARSSASRHDPRQEPYAAIPHVRICAGGVG